MCSILKVNRRYNSGFSILTLPSEATVDPTEVTAAYSFHNKSGGITDYKLTIRRSTRRFVETWDAGGDTSLSR
jgi:hypothetical protein